ncbi:hypothetical protein N0B31_07485 [Salinirubellus salinus]|uniref:CHAT domain-containing protein n=1 Tax=Salinirubellus salinus TaxID=1364945 RepID=A0A9E7R7K0_9EURY|nr:hypothetical protein [Salinirubellus salinus]UWM56125.1 hypothetical protein N0B31_07485 [Salinirubellus salinus]
MVEWATSSKGVRVFGHEGSVAIEADDWQSGRTSGALPEPVDATVSGSASRLALPAVADVLGPDGPLSRTTPTRLPEGEYLVRLDTPVETLLRFRGPAHLSTAGDRLVVDFDGHGDVTVGIHEEGHRPPTVRVPATPAGVAAAVTTAGRTAGPTGPERSHPAARAHPPLVTFGDPHVPASVPSDPVSNVELSVPADYASLFAAAPLAYYLGAEVTVGAARPTLRLTGTDTVRSFPRGSAFADAAARLLRRVFFLDCYARETPGEEQLRPPGELPLDLDRYADRSMADRVAAALAFPEVDAVLPEWHLTTYVEPTGEHARALPYLLDRLSLCHPPSASDMDGQALLERTLDDFYRGYAEGRFRAGGEVATADRLDPDLRDGRVHAWLADGIPVSVAKTSTRAYENCLDHGERRPDRLRIDVVLNDTEMMEERPVADIYRRRAADLPVDVTVHESLSRAGLADVFESETDLVHYVGHCEVAGLQCTDGSLSTAGLDVGARTFFLNACGSFREGLSLVEGGAGAGAVTLTRVLNDHAATVGTTFARLLVNGFGIERALSLARRQILMGQDYAVVGDPTYSFAPAHGEPAVVHVEGGPETFDVRYEVVTARTAGRTYRDPFAGCRRLHGTDSETQLSADGLRAFLRGRELPVMYRGDLHWAPTFAHRSR